MIRETIPTRTCTRNLQPVQQNSIVCVSNAFFKSDKNHLFSVRTQKNYDVVMAMLIEDLW